MSTPNPIAFGLEGVFLQGYSYIVWQENPNIKPNSTNLIPNSMCMQVLSNISVLHLPVNP